MDQKETGKDEYRFVAFETLMRFGERYRADAEVRARIARGDASDLGLALEPGVEVRVAEQTADTVYFPMPPEPTMRLSDEALGGVSGGSDDGRSDYCFAGSSNPCLACACVT